MKESVLYATNWSTIKVRHILSPSLNECKERKAESKDEIKILVFRKLPWLLDDCYKTWFSFETHFQTFQFLDAYMHGIIISRSIRRDGFYLFLQYLLPSYPFEHFFYICFDEFDSISYKMLYIIRYLPLISKWKVGVAAKDKVDESNKNVRRY